MEKEAGVWSDSYFIVINKRNGSIETNNRSNNVSLSLYISVFKKEKETKRKKEKKTKIFFIL
jgi:hypothetical protein